MDKLLFIILSLFLLEGCGRSKKPPSPPPKVSVAEVKQQDVPIYIDAIGQVIAPITVNVRPQAAGMLMKANIAQGAMVKAGDILFEIDPRPYQAVLDEAKAQLAHDEALLVYATQTVQRYKQVVADDYVSILTYEQYLSTEAAAKAQVELDKASIRAAEINLNYCKVFAPVSGKISYFNVYVGNIVAVDDPNQITVIQPFSPIDVLFSLPQSQFEMIRHVQGNEGKWDFVCHLPEFPKRIFSGTTFFLDNEVNNETGTILLKGRLPNPDWELWPGEFIRVKVLHKMAPCSLLVPPSAMLIGKDGPYIYLVDKEGIARAQNVTLLTRTEEYAAFFSDNVHPGDTVITDGQINVAPGIKVNAQHEHIITIH